MESQIDPFFEKTKMHQINESAREGNSDGKKFIIQEEQKYSVNDTARHGLLIPDVR